MIALVVDRNYTEFTQQFSLVFKFNCEVFLEQFDMSSSFSKFKTQPNNHVVYSSFVDCIFTDIDKLGAKKQ